MQITKTPWFLDESSPKIIRIFDSEESLVLEQYRPCTTTRWKTREDLENLVGVRDKDREDWRRMLTEQVETFRGIVDAVNKKFEPVITGALKR